MEKKKTYIEDIERTLYDIRNEDRSEYKAAEGLTGRSSVISPGGRTIRNGCWSSA